MIFPVSRERGKQGERCSLFPGLVGRGEDGVPSFPRARENGDAAANSARLLPQGRHGSCK